MTPEQFQRIDRIFAEAAALGPTERRAFLDAECAGDETLRREVESLLAADAEAAGERISDAIARAAFSMPAAEPETGDAGLRFGPYLLVRELGRGGMGAVYQAMRADGEFLQTVAVKLVKRGMDSDAILHRFRAERQILAALSHPNIAKLLDGGTTPDGRPYLVMEYIDGQPLLEFAASRGLDVRERVALFRPICQAVDYAHRCHVLHRDLKPANVMVSAEGVPKLLDFGIAKLLLPELVAGGPAPTETGARLLTPDYASPEQIRGAELTRASDVFSLGVMLYHLLAGRKPSQAQTAQRASRTAADAQTRASLTGDLDAIIGMAIRNEPARRYASAGELDADLERYLAGMPVRARPDTIAYRTMKWTRRHALPLLAGGGLAAGASFAGLRWWAEKRNSVPAEAMELCRQAEQLARSDIRAAQPGEGLPRPLRESIDRYQQATRIAPRYVPAWIGLGGTAEFAMDYDASRSAQLREIASGAAQQALRIDPRSAEAHGILGALHYRDWRFADAAAALARSVEIEPRQPYVLSDLADCLSLTGRTEEAIAVLEKGLEDAAMGQSTHGVNVRGRVILLVAAAGQYRLARRYDVARERAEAAVKAQGNYAPARLQLGMVLDETGDAKGAGREFDAAFAMRPSDQRAAAALGSLYARRKRIGEARKMLEHLGRLHREGAAVNGSAALIHAGLGDAEAAVRALETAERAHEPSLPHRLADYRLRALRSDARIQAMIRRLGLAAE